MKNKFKLKSKKLTISPLDNNDIVSLRDAESDEHLRAAYGEMLDGCVKHPAERLWYTAWDISLPDGKVIGNLCFKGAPDKEYSVEIGYGINAPFEGKGYATEAVRLAVEWALAQQNCYYVLAQTEEGNRASERVLEKNGFLRSGEGDEGHLWEKERPDVAYLSIFMCLGLSIGLSFGLLYDSMSIGMCAGLGIGALIGILLDENERKHRVRAKIPTDDDKESK